LFAGFRNAAFSVAGPLSAVGSAGSSVLAGLSPADSRRAGSGLPSAGVLWGLLAGASFALLFITLNRAGGGSGPWPLVASQFTALAVVICLGAATGQARPPTRQAAGLAALTGVTGAAGEGLYFYATHAGLLAVTAVITGSWRGGTFVPGAAGEDSTWHVHFRVTPSLPGVPSVRRDTNAHRQEERVTAHKPGQLKTGTAVAVSSSPAAPAIPQRDHADRPDPIRGDRIPRAGRTLPRHDGGGPVRTQVTAAADMTAQAATRAGTPSPSAVVVAGLRKSYGAVQAVRGVSFTVKHGEIFALLGPNGAGKTTTLEILEGFRTRDAGRVNVLGADPGERSEGRALRERIGLVLQDIAVEPYLTVRETIARNAGYYPAPRDVREVIGLVGLAGQERMKVRNLSGGQTRRLDLALGLIGHPELLFLDEPTTGFDPNARHEAWQIVRNLRRAGTTILLTTHYMDEAQALADRVAVISDGQIVAEGTPATIGGRDTARARIHFALPPGCTAADLPVAAKPTDGLVTVQTADPTQTLHELTGWALRHGTVLDQLTVDRPSL
jgi:ABC-2 type transport system ATP-binding protein